MRVYIFVCGLPWWLSSKESNAGDAGLITELERSPGEGNRNPLQYSCLGNPMDREAWRAAVHGVENDGHMTEQLNNGNSSSKREGKEEQQKYPGLYSSRGFCIEWKRKHWRALLPAPHLFSDHSDFLNLSIPLPSLKKTRKSSSGNLCILLPSLIIHRSYLLIVKQNGLSLRAAFLRGLQGDDLKEGRLNLQLRTETDKPHCVSSQKGRQCFQNEFPIENTCNNPGTWWDISLI